MPEKNNKDQRANQVKVTLNNDEKKILDKLVELKDSSKAKVFQSLLNEYGTKEISKYSNNFDLVKSRKKLKLNKIENKSYIKYGFPYVGLNWIPHLTIGSVLDKKLDHKFSNKFFSFKKKHSVIFIELVICEVINNKLREIQKIKL